MAGNIVIGNTSFEIKDGYSRVSWKDVVNGDHVYTVGNKVSVNGPFEVYDKDNRVLRNIKLNRLFTEYPESLLHKD
jgi:hypothetical protein